MIKTILFELGKFLLSVFITSAVGRLKPIVKNAVDTVERDLSGAIQGDEKRKRAYQLIVEDAKKAGISIGKDIATQAVGEVVKVTENQVNYLIEKYSLKHP